MKHSTYLSLLLTSGLIFAGCNSSSDDNNNNEDDSTQRSMTLSGKTTYSKGVVCIDTNRDNSCGSDEEQTVTEDDGSYTLEHNGTLENGTQLVAEDGFNMILNESNLDRFASLAVYDASEATQNINLMTTYIASRVNKGASYADAKAAVASKYNMSEELIVSDPLDQIEDEEGKVLFLTIRAIEADKAEKLKASANAQSKQRATDSNITNTVITEEDSEEALLDLSFLEYSINEYTYKLEQYFLDLKNYAYNYIVGLKDDIVDGCYFDDNCTKEPTFPREKLNGVWYMWGLNACMEIAPDDSIDFRTADLNETYSIYYREYNSDFTLLKGWKEQGLVQIVSHTENNYFDSMNITYDPKELELETESNATTSYSMIRSSDIDACASRLR